MVLSDLFSWRFVRFNEAFEKAKKANVSQMIEHPLFVYVNLVESQWLEDSYDELLRTVPYKSGEAWREPRHVQYHRLCVGRIETVHVPVKEVDGRPVSFTQNQTTTICLHFCRRHVPYHCAQ